MDELLILYDEQADVPLRETRVLWDRMNPLTNFNDREFRLNFRMAKPSLLSLVDLLGPDLERPDQRGSPLNPVQQTCLCLQYYATGWFISLALIPFLLDWG